jgi:AmmeMemoRadiSam system protein A
MIDQRLREILLHAAREIVHDQVLGREGGHYQRLEDLCGEFPVLLEHRGAFVTLKKRVTEQGELDLRGCIGSLKSDIPLFEEILRLSVEAAFHDPRFRPVTLEELGNLTFEISVLSELKRIGSYHDIRIGIDGIMLNCSGRRAVFLPQVSTEQQWDLETTLTHLSLKAGLEQDAWRDSVCGFEVFQAEVFSEDDSYGNTHV